MSDQEKGPDTGAQEEAKKKPKLVVLEGAAAALAAITQPLTKADILGADDRRFTVVPVEEWNGSVIVRALSGTDRDKFEASLVIAKGNARTISTLNVRAKLAALSIMDPTDSTLSRRLFADEEVVALGAKSAIALSRVYDAAAELSGISEADIEELSGNSEAAASDGSSPKLP